MQKLIFFARVAFICNVCFVLTWFMRAAPGLQQGQIASSIIVLGVGLAIILNCLTSLVAIAMLLRKKVTGTRFPYWLFIINFLFFIAQLILILR